MRAWASSSSARRQRASLIPAALGASGRPAFGAFSSPGRTWPCLPRAKEIEAAEFLLQLHRLVDDALLLFVVAQLDIAGQRKILAQRMTFEAVIGQDAAQIGMIGEINAEQIPRLALEPAGRAENAGHRRHRAGLRRSSTLTRMRWLSFTLSRL